MQVQATKLLFVQDEFRIVTAAIFVCFVTWVVVLLLRQSFGILRRLRTFYKDLWFLTDMFILAMSAACIVMTLIRMKMVGQYLDVLEKSKRNEFVSYFSLFYFDEILNIFAAILVCTATMRLWKFLKFGQMFRVLGRTISLASVELISITLMFLVWVLSFAFSGILLFGSDHKEFYTVLEASRTLVVLVLRPTLRTMFVQMESSAQIFFAIYFVVMQIVIFLFITIIIMAYSKAQLEFSQEEERYTIREYVLEMMSFVPLSIKSKLYRLQGGFSKDVFVSVEPKADQFHYANCVSMSADAMKGMGSVVKCALRRRVGPRRKGGAKLLKKDYELMLEVCRYFVLKKRRGGDSEVFFKGKLQGERVRLVDEKRFDVMEKVVKRILVEKEEKVRYVKKQENRMKRFDDNLKILLGKLNEVDLDVVL